MRRVDRRIPPSVAGSTSFVGNPRPSIRPPPIDRRVRPPCARRPRASPGPREARMKAATERRVNWGGQVSGWWVLLLSLVLGCGSGDSSSGTATNQAAVQTARDVTPQVSVHATGLDGPRGMTFGPDGNLYVAEAGRGGANTPCLVVPVVGPYHGGPTARVSRITGSGERVTVVNGLPSAL